jgi:hypothetical protein
MFWGGLILRAINYDIQKGILNTFGDVGRGLIFPIRQNKYLK